MLQKGMTGFFYRRHMEIRDYYQIIGVRRDATLDEIKLAYRKLARRYHPDISQEPDAQSRLKLINEACAVLKNPRKRQAYDLSLSGAQATRQAHEAFRKASQRKARYNQSRNQRQSEQKAKRQPGSESRIKVVIGLEDAYTGISRTIKLRQTITGSDGWPRLQQRQIRIHIPKGVHPKQPVRLAGQGGASTGASGDLYLEVCFRSHPWYRVDGKDVWLDLPITAQEAARGGRIRAPTPGGPVEVRIPPGSVSGDKLRLRGRGIPAKVAGDLIYSLQITWPKTGSAVIKPSLFSTRQRESFNPRASLGV